MNTINTVDVWREVASRCSTDPYVELNMAVECCDRWAADRGRLAMTVVGDDGTRSRWTYAEISLASARAAEVLSQAGVRRGDRVAGLMSRQVEAWMVALACWRNGVIYVPLFTGFGADAVSDRLRESGTAAVVVDRRYRAILDAAMRKCDLDLAVIAAGAKADEAESGDWDLWDQIDRVTTTHEAIHTSPNDLATLSFTSGTTSTPKACAIPHSGLLSQIPYVHDCLMLRSTDMLFSTSDPGWAYGLYTTGVAPMSLGLPRVVFSGDFTPAAWAQVIRSEAVTMVAGVPAAFRRLIPEFAANGTPTSLRGAACAGEQLDDGTASGWRRLGHGELLDGYGLTEVGMVLADRASDDSPTVAGALTGPIPGFEVSLLDGSGNAVAIGEVGEIAVRRPPFPLSIGYTNNPDEWTARWHDDWFMTRDLAKRDESGRWWYFGRVDDLIVTSGYNVGPGEVEAAILTLPDVADVAVVASNDPARGTVVRAVVVRRGALADEALLTKQIQDVVRAKIGRHAYPKVVDYTDALPRTLTGKLLRREVRSR